MSLQSLLSRWMLLLIFVAAAHVDSTIATPPISPTKNARNVLSLSNWAEEEGILMHENLKWKDYGNEDWGLVLTAPVPRGTVLLQVPKSLVLDANVLQKKHDEATCENVRKALDTFAVHEENFWIVLELYRLKCQTGNHKWDPWLAAMPQEFPEFTSAEQECLPYYAKYAAQYQDSKFKAFCQAAIAIGELKSDDKNGEQESNLKWAFQAVNSRFWKQVLSESAKDAGMTATSELVPVGDMFNHRDPPNVQMVPADPDYVTFAYSGDENSETSSEGGEQDVFITYGQPGNPHRFLVIFGFVPGADSMPRVWSHQTYSETNPYASQVDLMTLDAVDGTPSQHVWDAILFELMELPIEKYEAIREEKLVRHKKITTDVLQNHLKKQLDELAALKAKIDATEGPNMNLIRHHNEFLTSVFSKARDQLIQ